VGSLEGQPGADALLRTAYQKLAVAVLRQAVLDSHDRRLAAHLREGAAAFLQGAAPLDLWAGLADLSPSLIRQRAGRAVCAGGSMATGSPELPAALRGPCAGSGHGSPHENERRLLG